MLLKDEFTCATPAAMFLRSLRFARVFSRAIGQTPLFLLAGNGLCGAFAGASVGVGALTANRQVAAVTQTAVATEVHQTLDVHLDFAAQVAFDGVVRVDVFADLQNFGIAQFVDAAALVDANGFADLLGPRCGRYR